MVSAASQTASTHKGGRRSRGGRQRGAAAVDGVTGNRAAVAGGGWLCGTYRELSQGLQVTTQSSARSARVAPSKLPTARSGAAVERASKSEWQLSHRTALPLAWLKSCDGSHYIRHGSECGLDHSPMLGLRHTQTPN